MSEHRAEIIWRRETESFAYEDYNRSHIWRFDGGIEVAASAAPAYLGDSARVDPEEAFVAAISSCHMLTFLAVAARKRLVVENYRDRPIGIMTKNADDRLAVTRVNIFPQISFAPDVKISEGQIHDMHELSHRECFIANSVTTKIVVNNVNTENNQ